MVFGSVGGDMTSGEVCQGCLSLLYLFYVPAYIHDLLSLIQGAD